jgi:hypothetical protein
LSGGGNPVMSCEFWPPVSQFLKNFYGVLFRAVVPVNRYNNHYQFNMSTFVTGYDLWETASDDPPQPVAFDPGGHQRRPAAIHGSSRH